MLKHAHIAGCFLVVASFECAAQTAYTEGVGANVATSANGSVLYRFSLSGKTAQAVGPAGTYANQPINVIAGLTFSPDDSTLYAVGALPTPVLLTIATNSGKATVKAPLANISQADASQASLAFSCDNQLWMASPNSNRLWKVDPNSGATQLVGALGAQITGIATFGKNLYGAGGGISGSTNPNLYTIDTNTAAVTLIGGYGVSTWLNQVSVSFDGTGQLWSVNGNFPTKSGVDVATQWNSLAKINPASGAMTVAGDIKGTAPPFLPLIGLAIGGSVCTNGGVTDTPPPPASATPAPTLSSFGWWALVLSVAGLAAIAGRRNGVRQR